MLGRRPSYNFLDLFTALLDECSDIQEGYLALIKPPLTILIVITFSTVCLRKVLLFRLRPNNRNSNTELWLDSGQPMVAAHLV